MKPGQIDFATRELAAPEDWDRSKHGECGTLQIRDRPGRMESAWYPTPAELAALLDGKPVILTVWGSAHPPVSLDVEMDIADYLNHNEDERDMGACCACEGTANVRNIMMMDFEAPEGFNGWACLQCGLPSRGAIAILCDTCVEADKAPRFIAGGKYVPDRVRVPLEGFERRKFDHDLSKHPEQQAGDA